MTFSRPRQRVAAVLSAFAVLSGLIVSTGVSTEAAHADTGLPAWNPDFNNVCQGADPHLQLVPGTNSARSKHAQIQTLNGDYVPVLLIHGWTGDPSSFDNPVTYGKNGDNEKYSKTGSNAKLKYKGKSLEGLLQSIPGAAVYTLDYNDVSARWAGDESQIYSRVRSAINCLYNQSGHQVLAVTHSMGGLALRKALQPHVETPTEGPDITGEVGQIVTYAAPESGSEIDAAFWNMTGASNAKINLLKGTVSRDPLVQLAAALTVSRPLIQYCSTLWNTLMSPVCDYPVSAEDNNLGHGVPGGIQTLLKKLPTAVLALNTLGAIGLRTGQSGIQHLPPWPSDTKLTALYGQANVKTLWMGATIKSKLSQIGLKFNVDNIGDGVVTPASATNPGGTNYTKDKVAESCGVEIGWKTDTETRTVIIRTKHGPRKVSRAYKVISKNQDYASIINVLEMGDTKLSCTHSNVLVSKKLAAVAIDRITAAVKAEIGPGRGDTTWAPTQAKGWTVDLNSVGPFTVGGLGSDVMTATGSMYQYDSIVGKMIKVSNNVGQLICDPAPGSEYSPGCSENQSTYCKSFYANLFGGSSAILGAFDPLTVVTGPQDSTGVRSNDFTKAILGGIFIRATGNPLEDAKLPKTRLGIGIGSSSQDIFNAYGSYSRNAINGPNLTLVPYGVYKHPGITHIAVGNTQFARENVPPLMNPKGLDGGWINFTLYNGKVVSMNIGHGDNEWSPETMFCKPMMQNTVLP